ncbi:MAG TPA: 50S ribosomal protein L4 [Candidatus Thermoplasmatota archaeon]|nr:50S ribosomal protein L4 [Candidatus Thermoplasmatota archaeon]
MTDVNVYSVKGDKKGKVALPAVFATPLRPDLIRKAVSVARANRRQRYGVNPMAGKRHSTESVGKGKGMSRVPRLAQGSAAALAPSNVGGRRAHPPEARRRFEEKMNIKENRLAIASALGATASREAVTGRGHKLADGVTLPVVVEDAAAKVVKTQDALELLDKLGLGADIARARDGRTERSGMAKLRGRRYKTPKSVLIVTADKAAGIRGFSNIPGVDVITAREISAEALAPGGDPGRLVVFTESALKALGGGKK